MRSRFFGRAEEQARLHQALAEGARLMTICGPGGMGKTRLAREWAAGGSPDHTFVDLTRNRAVLSAIARALELRPGTSRTRTLRRVKDALAGVPLLVLDNAEEVLDEVAELCGELSAVLPVLVTSRESLRVSGERVLELGPLPPESSSEMLLDRTTAARAGATPSEEERSLLAMIASDLDGIPLALELAGSRLGVMSAATFSRKLHRRFDLLVSTHRGLDPRHRTLRAALDASFELLSEEQQRAVALLGVFSGGFELDAAEAMLEGGAIEAVEDLQQKSWLVRRWIDGEPRFDMYETIRSYAREQLDALGLTERARERHAEYFVQQAESAPAPTWIARERDNLTAILAAPVAASWRARAALAMEELLAATESSAMHVELLDRIRSDAHLLTGALRARLLLSSARAKDRSGDARGAKQDLDLARQLARRTEHADLRIEIATFAVTFAYMHGRLAASVRRGRRTAALLSDDLSPRVRALLLTEVGVAQHMAGDRDGAGARYRAALEIAEAGEDRDSTGRVLACIGFLHQDHGALDEAEVAYQRALAIQDQLGHRDVRGIILGYLGNLERRRGHLALAESYYARALEDLVRIGDRQFEPVVRMDRGLLLLDQGRWSEAEALLVESMNALENVESPDIEAIAKSALAVVEAKRHRFDRARALLDDAVSRMPPEGPRTPVLSLHRALVELEADRRTAPEARAMIATHARAAEHDDYIRLSAQLLEHALLQDAVRFERGGAYFQVPGAEPVPLERREPLRRILAALVRARSEEPDRALPAEELSRAGWPEEKILESAARNRVRVAVATLRNLGLREVLLTRGSSYLIDPAVRVVIE